MKKAESLCGRILANNNPNDATWIVAFKMASRAKIDGVVVEPGPEHKRRVQDGYSRGSTITLEYDDSSYLQLIAKPDGLVWCEWGHLLGHYTA